MNIVGLLINLIILCIVLGLVYWCVTLLPLPAPFKILVAVTLIAIVVLLAWAFGGMQAPIVIGEEWPGIRPMLA